MNVLYLAPVLVLTALWGAIELLFHRGLRAIRYPSGPIIVSLALLAVLETLAMINDVNLALMNTAQLLAAAVVIVKTLLWHKHLS